MSGVSTTVTANGKSYKVPTGHFINNEFVESKNGKRFETVNPATGKVICSVAEGDAPEIDLAVDAAQKCFDTAWGRNATPMERTKLMLKFADLIEANKEELAAIESLDNGKAYGVALTVDLPAVIDTIRYYAGWSDKDPGQMIETDDKMLNYTVHEPIGVCGQIIPWNFPLLMFAWKFGPAITTGNTVVMKTAEQTPLSALRMCELIKEAGFPAGMFNVVNGFGATAGAALSSHMKVEKIAFTGSTVVGRAIMRAAANSNLKKVTLELGGKSPNIVFDSADLEQAVNWASFGIFFNHGQCCCAGSRILVQDTIYDKFVEAFKKRASAVKVGDPFAADTFQGPQVSQLQYDRIMAHVESGKKDSSLLMGGGRKGQEGFFIEPTVFTDVKTDSKIYQEEIFGPVVIINKFKNEEEVIKEANNTTYGLAAAIHTKDLTQAHRVAARIRAGTVWVNSYNLLHHSTPFGGYKTSGIGRELGSYALANYTQVKTVRVNLGVPMN